MPKILIFDIETFPNLVETWGVYEQNAIRVVREWELAAFAYKWLGEREVICHTRQGQKTDKQLCKKLHKVLSQADIVVAHNGDSFDNKKARARMLHHGLPPVKPYKQIDTKKIAKRRFAMNSNSLDAIGKFLGVGRKEKTGGYDLWADCMAGKASAWRKMAAYNKQDVALLERVYLKLRPHDNMHPNVATIAQKPDACPRCGTEGKMHSRGFTFSRVAKFAKYQCQACSGWATARVAERTEKPKRVSA